MIEGPVDHWEGQLHEAARGFIYPPTPDLAGNVARRLQAHGLGRAARRTAPRLAWVAAAILVLFAGLMAVPSVRAQILEFLQVGIVRIFLVEPEPTQTSLPTARPGNFLEPGSTLPPTPTPKPTPAPQSSLLNLLGETSLDEASQQLSFPIQLPGYPEDLGMPDLVYLQDLEGQVLVLVWLDPERPGEVRMSLHTYGKGNLTAEKLQPRLVQVTQVNGKPAAWAEGPYLLKVRNGDYENIRLIEGHVLIWEVEETTYRLETDLSIEEAVRVAESLQPLEPSNP
jgi:hypothetical protein